MLYQLSYRILFSINTSKNLCGKTWTRTMTPILLDDSLAGCSNNHSGIFPLYHIAEVVGLEPTRRVKRPTVFKTAPLRPTLGIILPFYLLKERFLLFCCGRWIRTTSQGYEPYVLPLHHPHNMLFFKFCAKIYIIFHIHKIFWNYFSFFWINFFVSE